MFPTWRSILCYFGSFPHSYFSSLISLTDKNGTMILWSVIAMEEQTRERMYKKCLFYFTRAHIFLQISVYYISVHSISQQASSWPLNSRSPRRHAHTHTYNTLSPSILELVVLVSTYLFLLGGSVVPDTIYYLLFAIMDQGRTICWILTHTRTHIHTYIII